MDSVIDFTQLALQNIWTYGASFVLVMGVLVFIHEWGHYIVARLCGIRVEVFSIGFGKEIYGWTDKAGTRWKIAMIPLGGYVKMFGDSDPASAGHTDEIEVEGKVRHMTEEERGVAFFAKPVWKRSAVVFAGPAINFVFAIIVLSGLYMTQGRPITPPQVTGVEVGSGAEAAGFKPHDIIKSVNGKDIDSFREIQRTIMLTIDGDVEFVVDRGGQVLTIKAHPKTVTDYDRFGFAHEKGYLGLMGPANGIDITQIAKVDGIDVKGDVSKAHAALIDNMGKEIRITTELSDEPYEFIIQPPMELNKQLLNPEDKEYNALFLGVKPGDEVIRYNPVRSVGVAIQETWRITADTLKAIGEIVTGTRSTKELGGVIRIGAMAGDMAEQGVIALVVFSAFLSINLGMINLFPIPMLDGGHLVFYAIEALRGKPVSERAQEYAFRFGFFVLITLMVFSNLNDVLQLFVFTK